MSESQIKQKINENIKKWKEYFKTNELKIINALTEKEEKEFKFIVNAFNPNSFNN